MEVPPYINFHWFSLYGHITLIQCLYSFTLIVIDNVDNQYLKYHSQATPNENTNVRSSIILVFLAVPTIYLYQIKIQWAKYIIK